MLVTDLDPVPRQTFIAPLWGCGLFRREGSSPPADDAPLPVESNTEELDPLEDPRIPRRGWRRFFRDIASFFWVIIVVYFTSIGFNLFALFSNNVTDAPISISDIANVLALGWLLSLSRINYLLGLLVLILIIMMAITLVVVGRWAAADAKLERAILEQRRMYWKILRRLQGWREPDDEEQLERPS
jgi:hypothetical protein